jgi:hypothetical protein
MTLIVPLMMLRLEHRWVVTRVGLSVVSIVDPIHVHGVSWGWHCMAVWWVPWADTMQE